jgi:hypothetical protein
LASASACSQPRASSSSFSSRLRLRDAVVPSPSAQALPPWVLQWLQPRGQQINHLEALAMACARATFPEALLGKRVVHFVDNTVALSAAVHGYANEPDRAHGRRSSTR